MSAMNTSSLSMRNLQSLKEYPALTVGLPIFTFILLIVDMVTSHALSSALSLFPGAILQLDLNRVSLYILCHKDVLHWGFNFVVLVPLMMKFERSHGTVHTGITLNLLAVISAIQYSILGSALFRNEHVIGMSGIYFSFLGYFAYKERLMTPDLFTFKINNREYSIPTLYAPFILLFVYMIILPGSSFWGHLTGLSAGYLLALKKLAILYPPSKVIIWIEKKLEKVINLLQNIVTFIPETEAIELRGVAYEPYLRSEDAATSA